MGVAVDVADLDEVERALRGARFIAVLVPEILLIQNDLAQPVPFRIALGNQVVTPTLPADSFATLAWRSDASPVTN